MILGLAIFGGISGFLTVLLFVDQFKDRRGFGWRHVDRLVRKLLDEMRKRSYRPDLVIGVGRGGAIVAGMLAGNLGHIPLAVLDTELDRSGVLSKASIRFPDCCPSLSGLSVLLVVGELYSGEDLRRAIEFAEERSPREVRTASLLTHPAASVRPDFVGLETPRPLTAPWRITDAYKLVRL